MRPTSRLLFTGAAILVAAPEVLSQSWLPQGIALPGNSSQTSNWRGARRHQVIYAPAAVPPRSGAIQALVLRADEGSSGTAGVLFDVEVLVSSVGVPQVGNVDLANYTTNHGTDATIVVPLTRVTLPPGSAATLTLPFVQPFPYLNGNPLLIQVDFIPVAPGVLNPVWMLDTHNLPLTFWGLTGTVTGTGCPAGGQWDVFSDSVNDAFTFRWGPSVLAGSPPGFLMLGTNNQTFGGQQLPLSLAFLGAPGCMLRTSIEATYGVSMVLGGGFSWYLKSVPIPRDPRFLGATIHSQYVVFDPTANAGGLRLSELRSDRLATAPAPLLTRHLYGPFVTGFPITPEVALRNHTPVFGLQ